MNKDHRRYRNVSRRQQNEKSATKRSMRAVSEICFDKDEEDRLLDLVAALDNITLQSESVAAVVAAPAPQSSAWDSTDDSSDSNETDSTSDSEDSDTSSESDMAVGKEESLAVEPAGTRVMSRAAFMRKLVRDDRFDRKNYKDNNTQSAEVVAARIRTSIKAMSTKPVGQGGVVSSLSSKVTTTAAETKAAAVTIKKTLRINAICDRKGKKGVAGKIMVVDRDMAVPDLLQLLRNKFSVAAKYNSIMIQSKDKLLDAFDMMDIEDGETLQLVQMTKEQQTRAAGPTKAGASTPVPAPAPVPTPVPTPVPAPVPAPTMTAPVLPPQPDAYAHLHVPEDDKVYHVTPITPNPAQSGAMKQLLETLLQSEAYQPVQSQRNSLPIFAQKKAILDAIRSNQVVVVCGETGSGKSTQLPIYILHEMIASDCGAECSIVCTQPRRIAAISLAERSSWECGERAVGQGHVGYQIRLDACVNDSTRLLYCTTGILLQKLQSADFLDSVSHIILDEVHERGVETDFLMAIVKQQLAQHPRLRVVLMSATMQESKFREYFYNCPIVYVSGRTFPVEVQYIDQIKMLLARTGQQSLNKLTPPPKVKPGKKTDKKSDNEDGIELDRFDPMLVAGLVSYIITHAEVKSTESRVGERGEAILIFVSGIQAIQAVAKALSSKRALWKKPVEVHKLHSTIPPAQQRKVFKPTKPGEWKIVLATNIAETSITVDDVTHVIDTGLMKEHRYDPFSGLSALKEVFVSRSSAQQRAGRAGRVRAGTCWRLYAQAFFDSPQVTVDPLPEIQRIALEEVVLQVLLRGLGAPKDFLSQCLQPPSTMQLHDAIACLIEIKAVLPQASLPLTALGYHLARMPMDVRLAKTLIYACLLECVEPVLTITAALSGKSPFSAPIDQRDRARASQSRLLPAAPLAPSDHMALVSAYDLWHNTLVNDGREAAFAICQQYFLSSTVLMEMKALREHYRHYLIAAGFLQGRNGQSGREPEAVGIPEEEESDLEEDEEEKTPQPAVKAGSSAAYDMDLVRCALCAGLFPRVIRAVKVMLEGRETIKLLQADQSLVQLHPSSLLFSCRSRLVGDGHDAFLVYFLKTANDQQQIQVFDGTVVPHLSLLLFGTSEIQAHARKGQEKMKRSTRKERALRVHVQAWVEMDLSELHLAYVRRVQKEIEELLQYKVQQRSKGKDGDDDCEAKQQLLSSMVSILLQSEGEL